MAGTWAGSLGWKSLFGLWGSLQMGCLWSRDPSTFLEEGDWACWGMFSQWKSNRPSKGQGRLWIICSNKEMFFPPAIDYGMLNQAWIATTSTLGLLVIVLVVLLSRGTKNKEWCFLCKWRQHAWKNSLFENYEFSFGQIKEDSTDGLGNVHCVGFHAISYVCWCGVKVSMFTPRIRSWLVSNTNSFSGDQDYDLILGATPSNKIMIHVQDMSKIMTWYVWMVTYLRRNVTIVHGVSYHLLGSQISRDLKIQFWLQVKSYISNRQFSKSLHLASYVSCLNAMAYDTCPHKWSCQTWKKFKKTLIRKQH